METHRAAGGGRAVVAVCAVVLLVAAAVVVPRLVDPHLRVLSAAPLTARWQPRLGLGTLPAVALVGLCLSGAVTRWFEQVGWRWALGLSWVLNVAWMCSLALLDGTRGISGVLGQPTEYLGTARGVHDVRAFLSGFIDRIPLHANDNWPVHVAGHPPGATLVFVGLDRLGLGSDLAAGLAVVTVAGTTAAAVAVTLRALAGEQVARRCLPFLCVGPFAIWQAVSADALFAAVVAWSVALAALAVTRPGAMGVGSAFASGVGMGAAVLLSYGLPLCGLLVLAVVGLRRRWWLLGPVALAWAAVMVAFAFLGFAWWEAYPVLRERYSAGLASERPASYWVWGNIAALAICVGPAVWVALARWARRPGEQESRAVTAMVGAGLAMVVAADLSLMSKAEVERIWLPFVPWLVVSVAWLPHRLLRRALTAQAVFAALLAHLVWSRW